MATEWSPNTDYKPGMTAKANGVVWKCQVANRDCQPPWGSVWTQQRRRIQFTPFWKLTRWGFLFPSMFGSALWINRGCDEYHNRTRFLIIPLVGDITVWAKGSTFVREHVHSRIGGVWEGYIDPDCDICREIIEDVDA